MAKVVDAAQNTAQRPENKPKTRAEAALLLPADGFDDIDLSDIYDAGCMFAAVLRDITHHEIGEPGSWDLWGSGPDELARLHTALDRMALAVRSSRALLTSVERRVRLGDAR